MVLRVLQSLQRAKSIRRVVVSLDHPAALDHFSEIRTLAEAGFLSFYPSSPSPAESALNYFRNHPTEPLLVTAADHPLLTASMIDCFCTNAATSGADVAVGVVAASLFYAHYPESRRTFIRLRGDGFCGANLFALCTPRAVLAAQFWVHTGKFRKRPWRLVSTFGLTNLALFALRLADLKAAEARASRVIGARVAAVPMPFAECALDVDTPADLELAARILAQREG